MTDSYANGQNGEVVKRAGTVQSVSIASRFLNVLAHADGPLALGVLARRAGTGNSTAHRYIQSLVKEGLARQDAQSGLYDLGPAALNIGIAALKRIDPIEIAAEFMKDLASRTAMAGGVAVWTERGPTVVRWYRSPYFSFTSVALGDVLPVDNTASGLIFQAFLPDSQIKVARDRQPEPFRGRPHDQEELDEIRRSCWSELTGHLASNVTGQAVPVFDAQGEIACALTTVTNFGESTKQEERMALYEVAKQVAIETGSIDFFCKRSCS
ncbi:IclR family transcriptional regulator [Roseibium algae]|uniref:IclR family transcriptional regulator n=1 Tax=Roseibium algae TaxID=3123038 RepID=A0ABU8THY2_9HYPH